ncbi:MAG: AAA family ATPase [Pirellulaceae bacterium]|nr:AAA family ATPase [Pirellulaceae bacterium]
MRFASLDLIAFGCFDNRRLDFDENPSALQIVYGPNEAGKSTCLRAIRQWLYGFSHSVEDNFKHAGPQLRIGGVLEKTTGERLEFIRRRGKEKSMRAADDKTVIDPSLLTDYLGGVEESVFRRLFSIDHSELRTGGQEISNTEGKLSGILFAAGSGISNLRKIQQSLIKDCEALFKPSAKLPKINDLLSKVKDAEKQVKAVSLSTEQWKRVDSDLAAKRGLADEISGKIQLSRLTLAQLERTKQGIPLAAGFARTNEQLQLVSTATLLPDDFKDRRITAETNLKTAKLAAETTRSDLELCQKQISEIKLPDQILKHRAAITQLQIKLGAFRKGEMERPQLEADIQSAKKLAMKVLQDMGIAASFDLGNKLHVDIWQRDKIDQLSETFKRLISDQSRLTAEIKRLQEEIDEIPIREASDINGEALSQLKQVVSRAQKQLGLESEQQKLTSERRRIESDTELVLSRMAVFQGTLDELERLSVPQSETVEKYAVRFAELDQQYQLAASQLQDSQKQRLKGQRDLNRLRKDRTVHSEADLQSTRAYRDSLVELAVRVIQGEIPFDSPVIKKSLSDVGVNNDLAASLENAIQSADQMADQMRRDADQVAELAKAQADLEERISEEAERQKNVADIESAQGELSKRWASEWNLPQSSPLSPVEMRGWLTARLELLKKGEKCREISSEIEVLAERQRSLQADLLASLRGCGITSEDSPEKLSLLLDFAERKLIELYGQLESARDWQNKKDDRSKALARTQKELADTEQELSKWQSDWREALAPMQLSQDRSPKEVKSFLQSLDDFKKYSQEIEDKQKQVADLSREKSEFETEVQRLSELVNLDVEGTPEQLAEELNLSLEAANKSQTKLENLSDLLQKHRAQQDQALTQIAHWQQEIDDLCKIAKCTEPSEFIECERLSGERQRLTRERNDLERSIADLAGEHDLKAFIAELREMDSDQVSLEIEKCKAELVVLGTQLNETNQQIGSLNKELEQMDGGSKALDMRISAEELRAKVRREAEEYIRLRLAVTILHQGMERYRERNQVPALARASEIFSELTDNTFTAILTDFDEDGNGQLLALRSGENTGISPEALSTGTCDQMYLAIRIALLENQFVDRQPMPLILDDILIHFDDLRSRAALRVLAKLAHETQVILFTHHRHLIDLAQQALTNRQFSLHDLTP